MEFSITEIALENEYGLSLKGQCLSLEADFQDRLIDKLNSDFAKYISSVDHE